MENFTFENHTKIIFGKDTIGQIGKEIKADGHERVLLVAGGGSIKKNSVYDQVMDSLEGLQVKELWGVQPNPVLSKVREGIDMAKDVDVILAVGGGSVIDSAKAIAAGVFMDDVWEAFAGNEEIEQALPLYTVLTLSATASEMNGFSVVTNEDKHLKWNIGTDLVAPVASVIDPSVQSSLPWEQTVNGAIDALSHIMERQFTVDDAEVTVGLNESLMRTILEMTDRLLKGEDYNARANLAWAATLAHNGLGDAGMKGEWAVHGIEHGVSALHPEVAHAVGLGILFPAWIEHVYKQHPGRFKRWANCVWGAKNVKEGIAHFREKLREWGKPTTLSEIGVTDLKDIADNVMLKGTQGNVYPLDRKDVLAILKLAK